MLNTSAAPVHQRYQENNGDNINFNLGPHA